MGNPRAQALCYHALGAVKYLLGEWVESQAALERSIELFRRVASTFGTVLGMQRLGVIETGLGHYEIAHQRLREALSLVQVSDSPMVLHHSPTRLYTSLTDNRMRAGDLSRAFAYLEEGYTAQQAVFAAGLGECVTCDVLLYPAAVAVHLAKGELEQAEAAATKADEATIWFHSRAWLGTARYLRGRLAEARGEAAIAADRFEQAAAVFRDVGQPYDLARSLEGAARVTGRPGALDEARRLYAQLGATPDLRRLARS